MRDSSNNSRIFDRAISEHSQVIRELPSLQPQLEMIARTLRNHRQQPWIMRRRPQAEIDQLVESAGFRKIDQLADEWGMFTVSLAQRTGA